MVPLRGRMRKCFTQTKMASKESIVEKSLEIIAAKDTVLFHKNRFKTLFKRVETVVDIVKCNTRVIT
jgi:hypothetical protein